MRVLLADDELPALRELTDAVSAVLQNAEICSFSKAQEAMEFAEKNVVDMAFLDINMRFMDGIMMAKRLTEINSVCNIIFCTGYGEYALDAMKIYCSDYLLKPISEDKIKKALLHLRHPLPSRAHRTEIKCFGNFDILVDGEQVAFKYKKAREMLAYLVDLNGAEATSRQIMSAIIENDSTSYFSNIRLDLINTLNKLGVGDIIFIKYGRMRIIKDKVDCDYYDYLDGKAVTFRGEYMSQYSFAEQTLAFLLHKSEMED